MVERIACRDDAVSGEIVSTPGLDLKHAFLRVIRGASAAQAIDYVARQPLLHGSACHLLQIGQITEETRRLLDTAAARLNHGGFPLTAQIEQGRPDQMITAYIEANAIDLLVVGAYGHSRLRTLFIGSTTSAMLRSCRVPVLLFR